MEIGNHWETIRAVFEAGYTSCLHFSVATVNEDGSPRVTPIGGLILRADQTGFYFEEHCTGMVANIERHPDVCIMAVNADKAFWGKSLIKGKFKTPPAMRLMGRVGALRAATSDERHAFQKRVAIAKHTKGYEILWERMTQVRDIRFHAFEPVHAGEMTRGLWP